MAGLVSVESARGGGRSRSFRGESGKQVVAEVVRWRGGYRTIGLAIIEISERRWRWLDSRGLEREWTGRARRYSINHHASKSKLVRS